MNTCPTCGNPDFAPHAANCPKYTADLHRVDGKPVPERPANRRSQTHVPGKDCWCRTKTAADYRMLSVKRSPDGDCLAIRNASRDERTAWVLFSEEGELTDGVDHDDVADWPDLIAASS